MPCGSRSGRAAIAAARLGGPERSHDERGAGGIHDAPLTTTTLSLEALMTTIANGREQMPAFGRALRPEDLHDVANYILTEIAGAD
jgi:mono/diheme cytochrome c family protein